MSDHPADQSTRDIPPDVLSAADVASMTVDRMLRGLPVALVAMAYRHGRDDAAGGPPDLSDVTLRMTAKAAHNIRPGVSVPSALAVIEALLVLGWRPPPAGKADTPEPPEPCS
jgi:hypothetical protein